jgi:plastocyanin
VRGTRLFFGSLLGLALTACGGSGTATTTAPGSPFPDPVVTISATGLSPAQVHMNLTQPVQFVNRDTVAHTLVSAPDLGYGDCADAARVGTIEAGQSTTVMLQHEGICALRDAGHPANPSYQVLLVAH